MQAKLLDIRAACEFLGGTKPVNPATVWRWVKEGRISPPRKIGPNITRFDAKILNADIQAGTATRSTQGAARYFPDGKPPTLKEIGPELGISKSRVFELERRALAKLREGVCVNPRT